MKLSRRSELDSPSNPSTYPRSDVGVVAGKWGPGNEGRRSRGGMTGGVETEPPDWCVLVDDKLTERFRGLDIKLETGEDPRSKLVTTSGCVAEKLHLRVD